MAFWEAIVLIVLIGAIARVLQARYQSHGNRPVTDDSAEMVRARDELRRLKERIQVLERVVTDTHGSHDLDREIDRLRDR